MPEDEPEDAPPATNDDSPQLTTPSGEKFGPVHSLQDQCDKAGCDVNVKLPRFSPEELLGITCLHELPDGQKVRAKIVKKTHDVDADNHQRIKMLVSCDDDRIEEIMSHNELCDIVADQIDKEISGEVELFTFEETLECEGPLKPGDPRCKGSAHNVLARWTDGSKTWEPLSVMTKCDPATLAPFAKEHNLLDAPGWKSLRKIARRAKVLTRMVNASKRKQKHNAIIHKFGTCVPRNAKEAKMLDAENGNAHWQDAMDLELAQILECKTFRNLGWNA